MVLFGRVFTRSCFEVKWTSYDFLIVLFPAVRAYHSNCHRW
jgi:hypothetical protein